MMPPGRSERTDVVSSCIFPTTISILFFAFAFFAFLFPVSGQTADFQFRATVDASVSADKLAVTTDLSFESGSPLYNGDIYVITKSNTVLSKHFAFWKPFNHFLLKDDLVERHDFDGDYPILIWIIAQDQFGAWASSALTSHYNVTATSNDRSKQVRGAAVTATDVPRIQVDGHRIRLDPAGQVRDGNLSLISTGAPNWSLSKQALNRDNPEIEITQATTSAILKNFEYRQVLALLWVVNGHHYTYFVPWSIATDSEGGWVAQASNGHPALIDQRLPSQDPQYFYYAAILVFLLAALWMWKYRSLPPASTESPWRSFSFLGIVSAWTFWHLAPTSWLTDTFITGGDVASHLLYAHRMIDWVHHGNAPAWMPEVFGGFPAFSYYFPLPFVLIAIAAVLFEPNIAIKLIVMLPALLIPISIYWFGVALKWSVAQRLLAVLAAIAFLFTDETSFWGGNIRAQLAGEFAYSWALFFSILYFAILARSLETRRPAWIFLAAATEAAVALSHGFALLVVGFASFGWLLFARNRVVGQQILLIHLLAFCLIGFWLVPLFESMPWTIPNDGASPDFGFGELWGQALWPFLPGIFLIPFYYRSSDQAKKTTTVLVTIILVAMTGFVLGRDVGLASIRFYPFAKLALAVLAAVAIGWTVTRIRNPYAVIGAAMIAFFGWWAPQASSIEHWAAWNLSGYEAKPAWRQYQEIARLTGGPLSSPRVLVEHDPDNNDTGSTRTFEALPLFGSRPVLEGLYMESSITSPFVYQLQADVSSRPSSPLSRFPVSGGSVDRAVVRLHELYADTLVLRSDAMKNRFLGDPRFTVLGEVDPFLVLKLKLLPTQLVDPVEIPTIATSAVNWMDVSFRRFRTELPHRERLVFDPAYVNTQPESGEWSSERVSHIVIARNKIVFDTQAVGVPHIIRMSYHPRWHSTTGEKIYLTEPSFMLVVPNQSHVELVFGNTIANYVGWVLGLLVVPIGVWVRCRYGRSRPEVQERPVRSRWIIIALLVAGTCLYVAGGRNSEGDYEAGHTLLREQQYLLAAESFSKAADARTINAYLAEALFWTARSYELGGNIPRASQHYQRILANHIESYWFPESMYRLIAIALSEQRLNDAEKLFARLDTAYPGDDWTIKSAGILQDRTSSYWTEQLRRRPAVVPRVSLPK